MSQASGVSALCGQEAGLPGDYAVAGREPRSLDLGYQFSSEVCRELDDSLNIQIS